MNTMTNSISLTYICLAIALSTSCNNAPQPAQQATAVQAKRYHLKGKVVSIDKQAKMANIDSEAIPGFMGAMTMPYTIKPEGELDKLHAGDSLTGDLVVKDENAWIENVTVSNASASARSN